MIEWGWAWLLDQQQFYSLSVCNLYFPSRRFMINESMLKKRYCLFCSSLSHWSVGPYSGQHLGMNWKDDAIGFGVYMHRCCLLPLKSISQTELIGCFSDTFVIWAVPTLGWLYVSLYPLSDLTVLGTPWGLQYGSIHTLQRSLQTIIHMLLPLSVTRGMAVPQTTVCVSVGWCYLCYCRSSPAAGKSEIVTYKELKWNWVSISSTIQPLSVGIVLHFSLFNGVFSVLYPFKVI